MVPGASRNAIAGWLGDTLRIRVTAPPERGMANAAVETFLCDTLGLPAGSVAIVAGGTSRRKVVSIEGLTLPEVQRRLENS